MIITHLVMYKFFTGASDSGVVAVVPMRMIMGQGT
jgi:hypothetical protein